jgi:hypothetical protein
MILSVITGALILLAATALAAMEIALNPRQDRFPCVNELTLWVLRLHTLALVAVAFDRFGMAYAGTSPPVTLWQICSAASMALMYLVLFVQVLRLRMRPGIWPRLMAHGRRVRRISNSGGPAAAALAKQAADSDVPPPPSTVIKANFARVG